MKAVKKNFSECGKIPPSVVQTSWSFEPHKRQEPRCLLGSLDLNRRKSKSKDTGSSVCLPLAGESCSHSDLTGR